MPAIIDTSAILALLRTAEPMHVAVAAAVAAERGAIVVPLTVVVEAQTAPLPPNTGSGTVKGGHTTTLWIAVVGLVAIALSGSSIATARRRG